MRKYEEERYAFENIKNNIYPWVTCSLGHLDALNGKNISEKDTPMIGFIGDLVILLVIKRDNEAYEIIKDNMLPPDCDVEMLYHLACENLARDVEFVIGNTLYGGFAILADGIHEASSLCFKHIWNVCVEKLQDDLLIMIPNRDLVLFAPASMEDAVQKMKIHGEQAYASKPHKISTDVYLFTQEGKELLTYEEEGH